MKRGGRHTPRARCRGTAASARSAEGSRDGRTGVAEKEPKGEAFRPIPSLLRAGPRETAYRDRDGKPTPRSELSDQFVASDRLDGETADWVARHARASGMA